MVDVLIACVPLLDGNFRCHLQLSLVRGSVNRNDVDRRQPWRKLPLVVPDRSIRLAEDSKTRTWGTYFLASAKPTNLLPFLATRGTRTAPMANNTGMNAMSRKGKWTVRARRACRDAWEGRGKCFLGNLFLEGWEGDEIHVMSVFGRAGTRVGFPRAAGLEVGGRWGKRKLVEVLGPLLCRAVLNSSLSRGPCFSRTCPLPFFHGKEKKSRRFSMVYIRTLELTPCFCALLMIAFAFAFFALPIPMTPPQSEEEALTARIIHYFSLGVLQLPDGTTLRAYLAQKLDCDPMRITKKFTGTNCLGKRVYHSCERTTATYEVAKQAVDELAELETRFRARLERNKEKRSGILGIEVREEDKTKSTTCCGLHLKGKRRKKKIDVCDWIVDSEAVTALARLHRGGGRHAHARARENLLRFPVVHLCCPRRERERWFHICAHNNSSNALPGQLRPWGNFQLNHSRVLFLGGQREKNSLFFFFFWAEMESSRIYVRTWRNPLVIEEAFPIAEKSSTPLLHFIGPVAETLVVVVLLSLSLSLWGV